MSDKEKLILIAKWFDLRDKSQGLDSDINNKEVQQDLLRIAKQLAEKDIQLSNYAYQIDTAKRDRDKAESEVASLKETLRKAGYILY